MAFRPTDPKNFKHQFLYRYVPGSEPHRLPIFDWRPADAKDERGVALLLPRLPRSWDGGLPTEWAFEVLHVSCPPGPGYVPSTGDAHARHELAQRFGDVRIHYNGHLDRLRLNALALMDAYGTTEPVLAEPFLIEANLQFAIVAQVEVNLLVAAKVVVV